MWAIRISHPGLNKYRVVKGETQFDAEQKAAWQVKAWNERWQRIQQAQTRRMQQAQSAWGKEQQKRLADSQTSEAAGAIAALDSLLRDAVGKDHRVNWSGLKDSTAYPEPEPTKPAPIALVAPPSLGSFPPALNWLTRLIPPICKKRKAEAKTSFDRAIASWREARAVGEKENLARLKQYETGLTDWNKRKACWLLDQSNRNKAIDEARTAYMRKDPQSVRDYCEMVLATSQYPDSFPCAFELDYIPNTHLLVVDYSLPPIEALPENKAYKYVAARNAIVPVPVAESWLNKTYDSVLYQISLRTIFELFQSDDANALESAVFNGWVNSVDRATGKEVNDCIVTVQASKAEFLEINLAQVDPHACFKKLKGISASKLTALSPVRPILRMNREDKRFIAGHAVVDSLDGSANLAAMEWEDFEHLIRELFEKEFSKDGTEVKITQASRDGGVDAVVFDPDPIRGGKIVIQAKRYTNTVSVSAVRDLFGTIHNEGANKGILVTTADYGPDAYEFAKGKPITLLSGSELLYLLQKHGHKARIDLAEAKILAAEAGKPNHRILN